MELKQKHFYKEKIFTLHTDFMEVMEKNWNKYKAVNIKYDEIPSDFFAVKNSVNSYLFISVIFGFFLFVMIGGFVAGFNPGWESVLLYLSLTLLFGLLFKVSIEEFINFGNEKGTKLSFYRNHPNEKVVLDFISEMITKKDDYINKIYSDNLTSDTKINDLQKISVLMKEGFIDQQEFHRLKTEILNKYEDFNKISLN